MLYVFHVDSGKMKCFELGFAVEKISVLQQHIQETFKITPDKQVLLLSGGECLDPEQNLCSYSAGTETNPIFLFSKAIIEAPNPPAPIADYTVDQDIEQKVREHCDMPVTLATVTKRTQLAQHIQELAREQYTICNGLVHDQHLQQQGWAAVVANLEDITLEFKKRSDIFVKSFTDYMEERESYFTFLKHFNKDLETLQRIPVLSVLLEIDRQNAELEELKTLEDEIHMSQKENLNEITLYQWISKADTKNTLDQLYEHCSRGLEQFDAHVSKMLKDEVDEMLKGADNPKMKEVKGLGERLCGLETLMVEAKGYLKQQSELAQSFLNNQNRATNTNDMSVIPDLCDSHKKQLQMMAQSHQQLCDIKRRCTKAKEELSVNLYHRLRWVMYIQNHILEVNQKLVIYHENLKRLRRFLEVLQQIHMAPATYLSAVAEVVRRRAFSQSFLLWASEIACHLLTIHNEEITRRKEFQSQFEGHFLNTIFPGMDDLPPSFATQAPSIFDSSLPKISEEDVERLKRELPDLAEHLNVPDISGISNFFLMKSLVKKEEDKPEDIEVHSKIVKAVEDIVLSHHTMDDLSKGASEPALASHSLSQMKDLDRGCESETDTEEFEKVGQSPLDLNFDKNNSLPRLRTQDAATSTEDSLQVSRQEHEKLKTYSIKLHFLIREAMVFMISEANEIKTQVGSLLNLFRQECDSLSRSFVNAILEKELKDRQMLENIKNEHELALNELKRQDQDKTKQIEDLSLEKSNLEVEVAKLQENLKDLQENLDKITEENSKRTQEFKKKLQDADVEREKSIKEAVDRLNREHKAEIENIRARFKLMTMERSPSDASLEKSGDFSSLPSHSTLLMQMTENFELDKEKAVSEALKYERDKWEKFLSIRMKEMETKFEFEKEELIQTISRRITDDKDKQIDILMEREKNLNLECLKHKNTIQQLTESGSESNESDLIGKINVLHREKEILQEELERLKATDLSASVAVCEGKIDVMTSPIKSKGSTSKSESNMPKTCKIGDQVLVMWDAIHENFRILQESRHLFFLHSDCLQELGLEVIDGKPNKLYCTGEVTFKDFCHAKRFKVPKGSKFFRVKVGPVSLSSSSKDLTRSLYQPKTTVLAEPTVMSQSQSTVYTLSKNFPDESGNRSLPSSPPRSHPIIQEKDEVDTIIPDQPEIFKLESIEHHFAEDSGIVESIEQAKAALDEANINDSENSDR